ncbi:cell cycle checkpoint protein RAD1 isoform X5 [Ptiloglossa arizonensis]|uniref:cell cycle checkpoint protein RAD1 isoform X5 n=1 Tax=Ptiloglossa arizonensis TaxID=3350558 RepID=UPI003F9F8EA7
MYSDTESYMLVAKLANLKTTVQLLKAINFKESATCFATENGLKVTVEDSKCMQASIYIPSYVFQEFKLKEDVIFCINLNVLVECLCMFWSNINSQGSSVALQLFYKGAGHPVTVLIEEDGIITDCSLKTQDPDELLDFHLEPENVLNKVVLQTELLKDILSELDPTSNIIEYMVKTDEGHTCYIEYYVRVNLLLYFIRITRKRTKIVPKSHESIVSDFTCDRPRRIIPF